ncbi:16S rRNA methyltransferase [Porphyromonadaceae bacterium COT-184 OH4590]|nr:16S rRNA methyltransferase [Porphyromonadaceae bacterium COT-184 OH4590]MDO4726813.1 16S rRNA (uracil(1498)-N(3))-methyltransferase [Porphyromonadaceae bacterium]
MHIFYTHNILDTGVLSEEESYHCIKVLRMKTDDTIGIIDGIGNMYEARIVLADTKHTRVEILSVQQDFGKRNYSLHLAVAPTKNIDRFEWLVEKSVEIGVDCITPLNCRFSERRTIKLERIEKIALSAAKQSLKAYLPKINHMTDFADLVSQSAESQRFVAHCYNLPKENLLKICKSQQSTLVLIGPEGDFSEQEIEHALRIGFRSASLSDSRLRTETAGVVATNTVALANII